MSGCVGLAAFHSLSLDRHGGSAQLSAPPPPSPPTVVFCSHWLLVPSGEQQEDTCDWQWLIAQAATGAQPDVAGSDDSARGPNTSGCRSRWPSPKPSPQLWTVDEENGGEARGQEGGRGAPYGHGRLHPPGCGQHLCLMWPGCRRGSRRRLESQWCLRRWPYRHSRVRVARWSTLPPSPERPCRRGWRRSGRRRRRRWRRRSSRRYRGGGGPRCLAAGPRQRRCPVLLLAPSHASSGLDATCQSLQYDGEEEEKQRRRPRVLFSCSSWCFTILSFPLLGLGVA